MIPEPSKRPWGHPLPAEAIAHLVHPLACHKFHLPFPDAHGNVVTWNGGLAVRIRSALPAGIELATVHFETVENSLRWPEPDEAKDENRWRPLDDDSGSIWRFGPRSPWIECTGGKVVPNKFTSVRVGEAAVVPLALLQLCARLPRCLVDTQNTVDGGLRFVWKAGEAVIKPMADLEAAFGILKPRRQHGAGASY